MEQTPNSVRSQSVPLNGLRLLLPNTCIAEVVTHQPPEPVDDAPPWLLGTMDWRGERIPVISFEAANDAGNAEPGRGARIVVVNGLSGDDTLPFYAILAAGIPRLLTVDREQLSEDPAPAQELPLALAYVRVEGEPCVIPDQDGIEALLKNQGLG